MVFPLLRKKKNTPIRTASATTTTPIAIPALAPVDSDGEEGSVDVFVLLPVAPDEVRDVDEDLVGEAVLDVRVDPA